ncbi:MAG: DUF3096 domain-containing protein [Candidatus Shapirobacteria bacterium]
MNIANVSPLVSLVFGILILLNPKFLSVLVGIWLIINGLLGLGFLRF